jgi:hypothetical protein
VTAVTHLRDGGTQRNGDELIEVSSGEGEHLIKNIYQADQKNNLGRTAHFG